MLRTGSMVVIGVVALLAARPANAGSAPDGMTFPTGHAVEDSRSKLFDFFHVEVTYAKAGKNVHEDYAGKTWVLYVKVTPPNKTSDETTKAVRDSLKAQGWDNLTTGGTIVAKHVIKDKTQWLLATTSNADVRMTVVEVGPPPHVLTLTPPAAAVEKIGDKDDFPYLTPIPGSTLKRTETQTKGVDVSIAGPGSKEQLAGPPVLTKFYDVPVTSSPYERMIMYRDAFEKAGWTVTRAQNGGDSLVVAHYAKSGRDVFAYLHDGTFSVADIGAQNDAKKLLDAIGKDGHVAIYGIYFDIDKDVLKPESEVALGHILELLKLDPKLSLEVQGHTDNTGKADHNKTLSEDRAASVKKWLVAHGVADKRLTPKGYGDTVPVGDNKTPDGRAKNRRVELKKL